MMKKGRCRTPGNYCTVAKQMHAVAGFPVSEALKYEFTVGKRSVARGLGPAHHSSELPLDRWGEMACLEIPRHDF